MQNSEFISEWKVLQNQFDSYEKFSLIIKLASIGLLSTAFLINNLNYYTFFLLLVLWLQDAIWKTFQSRIDSRLLTIEKQLLNSAEISSFDEQAFQFNSHYLENRPSTLGLIIEYAKQAIRPTVAFPHVFLVFILILRILD